MHKSILLLFVAVLFAADQQKVTPEEELSVLRPRAAAQQAQQIMREAEALYRSQSTLLCGEGQKPGECLGGLAAAADAAFKKLKASYAARGLDLQFDLSLKPAKPAAAKIPARSA